MRFVYTLCVMLVIASFGCASRQPGGYLVVIGGGLDRDNDVVYGRIIELAGAHPSIGVIPVASGVPEESGPGYVEDFETRGVSAELIDITLRNMEEARNPAKARQIEAKNVIFFTGGDQARVVEAFRTPDDTVGHHSLNKVLRRGGVIAGTSAGAAMMSDPCLRWGTSTQALLIGHSPHQDRGVGIDKGMGFFPYGLTDQHFLTRGRLGRLVVALLETGIERGYAVDDNRAMEVHLASGRIVALGDRALIVVDVSEVRVEGLKRENVRISLLSSGDVVNGKSGEMEAGSGKVPVLWPRRLDASLDPVDDAWGDHVIPSAMVKLAESPATEIVVKEENFDLRFSKDERTRLYRPEFATLGDSPTIINLRMDILPHEGAAEAAGRLRQEIAAGEEGR